MGLQTSAELYTNIKEWAVRLHFTRATFVQEPHPYTLARACRVINASADIESNQQFSGTPLSEHIGAINFDFKLVCCRIVANKKGRGVAYPAAMARKCNGTWECTDD